MATKKFIIGVEEGDIWCAFAWPITIPMAVIRWIISKRR